MTDPTAEAYVLFQSAYDYFNQRLFEDRLPCCLITFQRQKRLMGYVSFQRWYHKDEGKFSDELAINPEYFANYSLLEIFQTLCHEMVHVWQAHFGKPGRNGYHNEEWARKMIDIGLMPTTTGKPGGSIVGQSVSDYILSDGHFLKVCTEFINTGIQMTWVDAFPIPRSNSPVPIFDANGVETNTTELQKKVNPTGENKNMAKEPESLMEGLPYSMEDLEKAFLAALPLQSPVASHPPPIAAGIPSSNLSRKRMRTRVFGNSISKSALGTF